MAQFLGSKQAATERAGERITAIGMKVGREAVRQRERGRERIKLAQAGGLPRLLGRDAIESWANTHMVMYISEEKC